MNSLKRSCAAKILLQERFGKTPYAKSATSPHPCRTQPTKGILFDVLLTLVPFNLLKSFQLFQSLLHGCVVRPLRTVGRHFSQLM